MRMRLALVLLAALQTFAAGRELAPRPLGPSAHNASGPAVAFAGGRFLTVWNESPPGGGTPRIAGTFSDAQGRRLSRRSFVIATELYALRLIATGDSFALFTLAQSGLKLVNIDNEGRVTPPRELDVVIRGAFDVAWNGTHFLATSSGWVSRGSQLAVLLDRDGTIVRSRIPLTPQADSSSIAAAGDSFVRVAVRDSVVFAERIASDGSVVRQDIDTGAVNAVAAPCPSGCAALAWIADDRTIRAATIDAGGSVSPVQTFPLPDAPGDTLFRPLHVLHTSSGFTLAVSELPMFSSGQVLHAIGPGVRNAVSTGNFLSAASSDDTILVAAGALPGVQGFAIDRSGSIRTEALAIDVARQTQPILGAGKGTAIAAFTELLGDTRRVRVTTIDADGTPLEHRIVAENASLAARDVAWNGSEFLTVVSRAGKLRALRLDANGERLEDHLPLLGDEGFFPVKASVAWAGDRWLVAWGAGDRLMLATLTANAIVSSVRALALPTAPAVGQRSIRTEAAIAFDGPQGIVAWIEHPVGVCPHSECGKASAFSMRIRRDVTKLDGIAEPLLQEQRVWSVSVAAGRGEFVAVTNADVAFDGTEFVIAERIGRELLVTRSGSARRATTEYSEGNEPPSVVTIFGHALVGVQEANAIEGVRATLYVEREMEPVQRRRNLRH